MKLIKGLKGLLIGGLMIIGLSMVGCGSIDIGIVEDVVKKEFVDTVKTNLEECSECEYAIDKSGNSTYYDYMSNLIDIDSTHVKIGELKDEYEVIITTYFKDNSRADEWVLWVNKDYDFSNFDIMDNEIKVMKETVYKDDKAQESYTLKGYDNEKNWDYTSEGCFNSVIEEEFDMKDGLLKSICDVDTLKYSE